MGKQGMADRRVPSNLVLDSIPAKEFGRLRAHLEPVILEFGQVLYEPAGPIRHVYFPVDSLISLLTAVDKRRTLEVGMVGNEGMAGIPFVLGMDVSDVRALVQGEGKAWRMASAPFRVEASLIPLCLRFDGADLANGGLQSLPFGAVAVGPLAADDS
jgi:hypothetical protein